VSNSKALKLVASKTDLAQAASGLNEFSEPKAVRLDADQITIDLRYEIRPAAGDCAYVKALAEDIEENGQETPIAVVKRTDSPGVPYGLVSGGHRLAACSLLSRPVRAIVFDDGDPRAMRLALKENLLRKNLTPLSLCLVLLRAEQIFGATS